MWPDVYKMRQCLLVYTDWFTGDVADGYSGFLYRICIEVCKLILKQRRRNEETFEMYPATDDSIPRRIAG